MDRGHGRPQGNPHGTGSGPDRDFLPGTRQDVGGSAKPAEPVLQGVLKDIQFLAQFRPNPSMPCYKWWNDQLAKAV